MDFDFVKKTACVRPKVTDEYAFNENQQQIIGRGSYGVVYKVRKKDETSMRFYALKVVELTPYSPSTCREIAVSSTHFVLSHTRLQSLLFFFLDLPGDESPKHNEIVEDIFRSFVAESVAAVRLCRIRFALGHQILSKFKSNSHPHARRDGQKLSLANSARRQIFA